MNASISSTFRIALLASAVAAAPAFADTMVVMDHNASLGPNHDATLRCYHAARDELGNASGVLFSNQVETQRSATGAKTIVVNGTIWQDGSRVAFEASCASGNAGHMIATVTRKQTGEAIAQASKSE
jgi:hypothetical protein